MRCLGPALLVVLAAAPARAQPSAPAPPASPPIDAPPQLHGTAPLTDGQELPRGAWPGVSLEQLRGLPECTLEDPPARINHEVTCRPPILPSAAHVSVGVGWSTGFVLDGEDVRGAHALGIEADYWLTRSLGLGVRYAFAGLGTATPMGARPTTGLVHEGVAMARYRLFTDEVDRDAITISVGAGIAARDRLLGGSGGVVRAAIARDTGYMTGEKAAVTWQWELAAEQGLGDATVRTITAGIRAGFELGIRAPGNLAERDRDPPIRSALAGELRASPNFGLAASLDFPLGGRALWRTTALWTIEQRDEASHGLAATWAAVTGPRVLVLPRATIGPYVDLQAGPAAFVGDPSARLGWIAEAEAGITIHVFCQTRIDLGGRAQAELDDGVELRTGFFVLRVSSGTALRRGAAACQPSRPFAR